MKTGLAQQIKKAPLERQAAAALRAKVLSGEFPPGYRLVETWLADQFQLSRGTVRAALSLLVHEGLVEQVAYTRWAVPNLSAKDAWELYTLRSSLEGLAARLVTERMTPAKAAELSGALQRIQDAAERDDRGAVDKRDAELHSLIVKLADHRRLQQQYTIIEQQTRRYIACSNALTVDCAAILKQHEPIVQALISGDPDAAEREAQRHNLEEGKLLVANLQSHEAGPGADAVSERRKAGADS
ncbi:GntR family transcriptional regulator [Caenimonas soli]|uniref:GntR family transcriptional regulator n=1 Tax=Caenimonas soli TaxID=2735555 RepID=UPI0015521ADA|nr:GntR family transcriptional regulator [Caenimonas soli]NPC58247.1 GntR family transcriptional regulator [Caenimonas soli]